MSAGQTVLPHPADLPALAPQDQARALTQLFEQSASLVQYLEPVTNAQHGSWGEFIEDARARLLQLIADPNDPAITDIIAAHPRLGAKKVESAASRAEQASLSGRTDGGDDAAAKADADELAKLNAVYEQTFPGLRYVVFVNGRPRSEIMADMRARIGQADWTVEVYRALNAMCDIALDRAGKAVIAAPSAAASAPGAAAGAPSTA